MNSRSMFMILSINTLTNLSQYLDNLIRANVTLKFIPDNSLLKKYTVAGKSILLSGGSNLISCCTGGS